MSENLEKEFEYYLKNKKDFLSKYKGKVIVIKNQQVIGEYDSELEAIEKTTNKHKIGSFLVQSCISDAEIQTYHSRVAFR